LATKGSSGKREAVALAVASGLSLRKAAAQCRVGQRTVMRWHAGDETFRRRIAELRTQLFDRAVGRLCRLGGKSAAVLGKLPDSDSERIRLAAAKEILSAAMTARQAGAQAAKVQELRRLLQEQGGEPP
jgi:hypothetical protein